MRSDAAVLLINPKFPHNVGQALRGCSIFGAGTLRWTGNRVQPPEEWPEGARLPREERMKAYKNVDFSHSRKPVDAMQPGEQFSYNDKLFTVLSVGRRWTIAKDPDGEEKPFRNGMVPDKSVTEFRPLDPFIAQGFTPVAVEVRENSEPLPLFWHPPKAVYVFGPEDGSLQRGLLGACQRFVVIPSDECLNLASAVNVTLYDRRAKQMLGMELPEAAAAFA